jgi:hypothetical protein
MQYLFDIYLLENTSEHTVNIDNFRIVSQCASCDEISQRIRVDLEKQHPANPAASAPASKQSPSLLLEN